MIPRINQTSPVQALYLSFINQLRKTGFQGDLNPDYANRTVLSTDNSIYQVLPQGVIYPKDTAAEAVILADYGESYHQYSSVVGLQMIYFRHRRIKILKKGGLV